MRELIKEVLNDYVNLLTEGIFFAKSFPIAEGKRLMVFFNDHSQIAIGTNSPMRRVYNDEVLESISGLRKKIFNEAQKSTEYNKTLKNLGNETSEVEKNAINIRDYTVEGGIDYHVWIKEVKENLVSITVNTSIYHPKKISTKPDSSLVEKTENIIESKRKMKIIKNPTFYRVGF